VRLRALCGLILLSLPLFSLAHSFGVVYTLPVPFWLYGWGASAALITSFVVVGYFSRQPHANTPAWSLDVSQSRPVVLLRKLHFIPLLQAISVGILALCIASGLWGSTNAYDNFNMTFFWIVFILGFSYLTALAGNLFDAISPWKTLSQIFGKISTRYERGVLRYPAKLAYWPALATYMGFIWLELFGKTDPASLAQWLITYSVWNLAGAGLFGRRDWFTYCEFFAVFLRLIASMAPVDYRPGTSDADSRLNLRLPFSGILAKPVSHISLMVFILFMLSSTAFDGLHETLVWKKVFWRDLYLSHLQHLTSTNPLAAFPAMARLYGHWQSAWLLLSPLVYLAVYLFFIAATRYAAGTNATTTKLSFIQLAIRFSPSLLPIALVYHIAHYYTLLQTQGVKIINLISDPFGVGSNWLGTANWFRGSIIPDLTTVWHTQVILIVLGHIVSVYLAHRIALNTFATHKQALRSQLPMLILMVFFTTAGLWILSKPVGN